MKIDWDFYIYHGKSEINRDSIVSIDISPFDNELATCGKDALIKIWSMRQFKTESGNRKIFKKKKFCKIIETQKMPINVIRWSFNGKLLASGGDSGNLTIYSKYIKKNQDNFFRTFHLFQNSQGDISSINWSPDSNFITTTSQTNDVIIFAVKKKYIFAKIINRIFIIKGSSWDPLGCFLLTQSNSQCIKIWNTLNWKLSRTIQFCTNFNLNMRYEQNLTQPQPIWSACGKYVIFYDNFVIEKKHCIRAFERHLNFSKHKIFFCGKKAIKNIRTSPRIYSRNLDFNLSSIVTITSDDGKLYLWAPDFSKILLVVKNLSNKTITDVAWKFNGYNLIVATGAGEIFKINFDSVELGVTLKVNRHMNILELNLKKYNNLEIPYLSKMGSKKKDSGAKSFILLSYPSFFIFQKNIVKLLNLFKKINVYEFNSRNKLLTGSLSAAYFPFYLEASNTERFFSHSYNKVYNILVKQKNKIYFLQKGKLLCIFQSKILQTAVNFFENKFVTLLHYTTKRSSKIISLSKKTLKVVSKNYRSQIKKINLRRNIIFVTTTTGSIDLIKSNDLTSLIFLNFLKLDNIHLDNFIKKYRTNISKCSGLVFFKKKPIFTTMQMAIN